MVQISTEFANNSFVDMTNPNLVKFEFGLSTSSDRFAWRTPASLAVVDIAGVNFNYNASGELTGGSIEGITVDIGNNGSDLAITDTSTLIGANIDKDDPASFWNEVLKGDDTFDLSGVFGSRVFGDDLYARIGTDTGGDDTITGGNNKIEAMGDVYQVKGLKLLTGEISEAIYHGGDDQIKSDANVDIIRLIGDAGWVYKYGTLYGGNDTLDGSVNTSEDSVLAGDVYWVEGGTVVGGNDEIRMGRGEPVAVGDVAWLYGGTVTGGNDTLTGSSDSEELVGDVHKRPVETALVRGGDDLMFGGKGNDTLYQPVDEVRCG